MLVIGKNITRVIVFLASLIYPATVFAVETGVAIPGFGNSFASYNSYISAVFQYSMKLGIVLTTLMIIYAGYKYMTSQGNPTAINEAKDIIIGSLSGFALLLVIYLVLNVLNFK